MKKCCREMIEELRSEKINTWFDLGLFIDRFKENRSIPSLEFSNSFEDFLKNLADGAIAFLTFNMSVNGVSLEIEKYAAAFGRILKNISIHYISGHFHPTTAGTIAPSIIKHEIKEIKAFDHWPLYDVFFKTKLERGSPEYNRLIGKLWDEVLVLTEKLGDYVEANRINLVYSINVNSNPGNISLSLALVFISEYLGIPVICNNHDFYWEEGNRKIDIDLKRAKPGPRDHFFTNSDIGEIFSLIEVLFPWESRSWMNANINNNQVETLIEKKGVNPANVTEIGTAIDMQQYENIGTDNKTKTLKRISVLMGGYKDNLKIYHPLDAIESQGISEEDPVPLMVGMPQTVPHDFLIHHIILLQSTRVIRRKRIEANFQLAKKMFEHNLMLKALEDNPKLNLTILITGLIATGHFAYFQKLLAAFKDLLDALGDELKSRIFLGFLFSRFDQDEFKESFGEFIGMPEIYNLASLVLLPSETEGRGLPIFEAAASGVPILCKRYSPENVYEEAIGSNLEEDKQLKVLEFSGDYPLEPIVDQAVNRILTPYHYQVERDHNRNAVRIRFGLTVLERNLMDVLRKLYLQLRPNIKWLPATKSYMEEYKKICDFRDDRLEKLLKTQNRQYLPGYGRVEFMHVLKSLIDPSYFRVEEQFNRSMVMSFARELIELNARQASLDDETAHRFYNFVDNIFLCKEGEFGIRHDHSLAYRHRNKTYYPYRDFTHQELTGLINLIFHRQISDISNPVIEGNNELSPDFFVSLAEMTDSEDLGIDDRDMLLKKIDKNVPFAYFPGYNRKEAIETFVLKPIRRKLQIAPGKKIEKTNIENRPQSLPMTYIFCSEKPRGMRMTFDSLMEHIHSGDNPELKLLIENRLCSIIKTTQWCAGIHFPQLGEDALDALVEIREQNGFIITDDPDAVVMTDIADIDRFHIGKATAEFTGRILGIAMGSGYIQFAPAGIRTTIAYPTPIQTAKDFSDLIKSEEFKTINNSLPERNLWHYIKKDAEARGSPLKDILNDFTTRVEHGRSKSPITYSYLCGLYEDGRPWSGVMAKANINKSSNVWKFLTVTGSGRVKTLTTFIEEFIEAYSKTPAIAWNGGFILNAELVGKLGLPEAYIGSPLGLIVTHGRVLCPPLYNKPAFLIYSDGKLDIKRVNCHGGITISSENYRFDLKPENRNLRCPAPDEICFYDLMHKKDKIEAEGRVIVRLAGNTILEIIRHSDSISVPVLPVGLALSFPEHRFPEEWDRIGASLQIDMKNMEGISHAIEAGPMLVVDGEICIDMEIEGWKTQNSIDTQAARLDFVDMRGPKIAIGLDREGNLSVLAVNGRIRESVGATHIDMAKIMIKNDISKAMGFDPGGSSTLVVDGKVLNISPYNSNYESDVWSLPPEPRAVANAVVGWEEL